MEHLGTNNRNCKNEFQDAKACDSLSGFFSGVDQGNAGFIWILMESMALNWDIITFSDLFEDSCQTVFMGCHVFFPAQLGKTTSLKRYNGKRMGIKQYLFPTCLTQR